VVYLGRVQIVLSEDIEKWLRSQAQRKGDLSIIINYALLKLKARVKVGDIKPWTMRITEALIEDSKFEFL